MKRIFHFVKSNNLSGLENVVINICSLVKGYDYTYVSTKGPIEAYLKKYGIHHITIPKLNPWNMLKVIKKYNPNIVQAHDARASVFLSLSYFYCKKHHIKMISELHNNDPKMKKFWSPRAILYALSSIAYSNIISVSKDIVHDYSYNFIFNNKTSIIHNIVNYKKIQSRLLPQNTKKWDCAFLGRMVYQKDPLRFVDIIYHLKKNGNNNIKAIMMGSGNLLNSAKRVSKKYNLMNNIYFTGFVTNPYKYLQETKLLIMTSRYEGLPLVALESVLIKTPVVSTNLNVLKQVLGKAGLFNSSNTQFVRIINNLLNNQRLYNIIRQNQFSRVYRFNNINHFIKSYRNIYK